MSRMRQSQDDVAVRGLAFTHPRCPLVLPHAASWDQLIYASSGVMTVHTASRRVNMAQPPV